MKMFEQLVPGAIRSAVMNTYCTVLGFFDRLRGKESLIPHKSQIYVGGGHAEFEKVGKEFFGYFVELAGLKPDERVLDVGCGIGRLAVPLTGYLSSQGRYDGFDIVENAIQWNKSHISRRFPNFYFQHVNVYNKNYNPEGTLEASSYAFPFDDACFDFIFLTSVFTHMLPADTENYISQIARVLKKGGRCLVTFFLLNDESLGLIKAGKSTLDMKYAVEGCLATDIDNPEEAIAYDEEEVRAMLGRHGLHVADPVHYGSWCARDRYLSYQDILIVTK